MVRIGNSPVALPFQQRETECAISVSSVYCPRHLFSDCRLQQAVPVKRSLASQFSHLRPYVRKAAACFRLMQHNCLLFCILLSSPVSRFFHKYKVKLMRESESSMYT